VDTYEAVSRFTKAMTAAGINPPPEIRADGELHRFPTRDKRGDDAGYYVLHADGIPAGMFGCWRAGIEETWCADIGRGFSTTEREAHEERMKAARRERERDTERRHADAARRAQAIWKAATRAPDDHPYLKRKDVAAHGVRLYSGREDRFRDCLVVPMFQTDGKLSSLQFIRPDGTKRFLFGGATKGAYAPIGEPNGVVCIAEGFATAASIREATERAVAIAFNCGNLEPVAKALRAKHPETGFIVCADNDTKTKGNPGLEAATRAARAIGAKLAVPHFGEDRSKGATDFNDLHRAMGASAVRECIDAAREVGAVAEAPSSGLLLWRASEIEAKPIRWLWPGRIARGKVSIIAGHPGVGKSQITAYIAGVVTNGETWPVDGTRCEQGSVVVFSAEDDSADTIRPRLEAVGADLDRAFLEKERRFNALDPDIPKLEAVLAGEPSIALVIVDPISAYFGSTDTHRNAAVRGALTPLVTLAETHNVAVVCVDHLSKNNKRDAIQRLSGSIGFVAAVRAAFAVTKDKDDPARRLFTTIKNNLAPDRDGLAFRIDSHRLESGIETSRVAWESEPVAVTADEAMASDDDSGGRSAKEEAQEFLRELLAGGPMEANHVFDQAAAEGHAEKTIRRAAETLGIEKRRIGFGAGSHVEWSLPYMAKKPIDAHVRNMGNYAESGHLWGDPAAPPSRTEAAEERAAIMEHDGEIPREQAEAAAYERSESAP